MDEAGRYETFPVGQAPGGHKIQQEPEVGLEGGRVYIKDDNRNSIDKQPRLRKVQRILKKLKQP